jgi:hypothetical protein
VSYGIYDAAHYVCRSRDLFYRPSRPASFEWNKCIGVGCLTLITLWAGKTKVDVYHSVRRAQPKPIEE